MPTNKQDLQQTLIAARRELLAALRQVQPEQREVPRFGNWSAKDIAGHVASWENRRLTQIERLNNGDGLPDDEEYEQTDDWNAREVRRKRGWNWAEILTDMYEIREELLGYIDTIPEASLDLQYRAPGGSLSIAGLIQTCIAHDRSHARALQSAAQNRGVKEE